MYILIVSATTNEINTTMDWLAGNEGNVNGHEIEVLITGIGGAMTAYAVTKELSWRSPELVIQAGIGGSFDSRFPPGSVAFISEEVFADLGAEENGDFTDIFDMGLGNAEEYPFSNRLLVNPGTASWVKYGLPFVRGATVNCITETPETIKNKYNPVIESMEGAALHYTCLKENIPFIQLRAVSNFVGERDKSKWMMREAIAVLNEKLKRILGFL